MDTPPEDRGLSARLAFVVHLRRDADPGAGRLGGRVEHVVTGRQTRFDTLDGLVRFIAGLIDGERDADGTEGCVSE